MTLVEVFKQAIQTGRLIRRRSSWFKSATLKAHEVIRGEWHLIRFPEQNNWSGEFSPSLGDLEATDWEVV